MDLGHERVESGGSKGAEASFPHPGPPSSRVRAAPWVKLWEGAALPTTKNGETEAGVEPAVGIHEAT